MKPVMDNTELLNDTPKKFSTITDVEEADSLLLITKATWVRPCALMASTPECCRLHQTNRRDRCQDKSR